MTDVPTHIKSTAVFGLLTIQKKKLLEKLIVPKLVKKFLECCGTRRFISVYTTAVLFIKKECLYYTLICA